MPESNDGGAEFRRIALSAGKGAKTERAWKPHGFEKAAFDDAPKPYGFESGPKSDCENIETIPCVVSAKESPFVSSPLPARPLPHLLPRPPEQIECEAAPLDAVTVRDDHNDPAQYDLNTGGYFRPPQKQARYQRQAADAWVAQRLPGSVAAHQ